MAEGFFVDVHYQGIELGRRLQFDNVVAAGAYLHSPAPMPVGTILVLDSEVNAELTVRVTRVSEQVAGSERPAGMFVAPHELSDGAQARWNQWSDGAAAGAQPTPDNSDRASVAAADPSVTEAPGGVGGAPHDTEEMAAVHDTEEMAAMSESAPAPAKDETKSKAKLKKKRARRKKAK